MSRRMVALLAAAVAVAGSALIGAPAHAATVTARCETSYLVSELWLTARSSYTAYGAYHHWHNAHYEVHAGMIGSDNNNVNIRLRTGSYQDTDPTHWSYDSPDTVKRSTQYAVRIDTVTPATNTTYLKFHAIFDIPLVGDRSCTDYTLQV